MSRQGAIGAYSPHLTALEKANLRLIEEGQVEEGMDGFLKASFALVSQVLEGLLEEELDETISLTELGSGHDVEALQRLFWTEERDDTGWGQEFRHWLDQPDQRRSLGFEDLNEYLRRSLPFYERLRTTDDLRSERSFDIAQGAPALRVGLDLFRPEAMAPEPPLPETLPESSEMEVGSTDFLEVVRELAQKEETSTKPPTKTGRSSSKNDDEGEELALVVAPASPFEERNRLVLKNKYLGYGKNSAGVLGLCGQLKISYFQDKELVGRLESSNPLLFFSPARLSGTSTTVTYWLPPVAFPHPAGHLSVRTKEATKTIALHTLFPQSRTEYLRNRHVLMLVLLPGLLGFLYFSFVYVLTTLGIDREVQQVFPDLYQLARQGQEGLDFRSGGIGLYRLKVVPASETLQMLWAAVVYLVPFCCSKFFFYLSRSRQRRFVGALLTAQILPSLLFLIGWNFQGLVFPLYRQADFAPLNLQSFLYWGVPANLLAALYGFGSVLGLWDRWLPNREFRFLLPVLLTALYVVVMFVIIYGRSWVS